MPRSAIRLATIFAAVFLGTASVAASTFEDVAPLIEASCIGCHDASTETDVDFESLGNDLSDANVFRTWVKAFDRIEQGEMPPASEPRPAPDQLKRAVDSLQHVLQNASMSAQEANGRVPARRLTALEYNNTICDLLSIQGDFARYLPGESDSGSFDTVGSTQRISALHIRGYLKAADAALDSAIQLGRNPSRLVEFDFPASPFLNEFHDKPIDQGGSISRKIDGGVALFVDVDYLLRSDAHGFQVSVPGTYNIRGTFEAYQSDEPVTLKVVRREQSGAAKLVYAFDLIPGEPHELGLKLFLNEGDAFYPTLANSGGIGKAYAAIYQAGGSSNYKGRGLAIKSWKCEGPLSKTWPPQSTVDLLSGMPLKLVEDSKDGTFQPELTKPPVDHVTQSISNNALRVFRRLPENDELDSFVELAQPLIQEGHPITSALRVSMRSMLSSPQFLFFGGSPGKLDDYALANRLSYFLWKSMPDDDLFALAAGGKLSDPEVLRAQVDRLLEDDRSQRFVDDYVGQWLKLYDVNATTPDEKLYPEYDELLSRVIPMETERFFAELVKENLSVSNLVDSEFAFVNRRLAEHYELEQVAGQELRKVNLPATSPRGGVLTQASVLKLTANGTVTSPVTRGNFVLTNLLGTPPSPPPPTIGSIEPDTRGKTTIRELLAAHRELESCNTCHREIDPPGFALECFDPIGGFRSRYRANLTGVVAKFQFGNTYKFGPKVDASGETPDGQKFSGIDEFKKLLLRDKEQIARNFISQLVVYSTGGEIQFADRDEIDAIMERTRSEGFLVRSMIHEVVQSRLFTNK